MEDLGSLVSRPTNPTGSRFPASSSPATHTGIVIAAQPVVEAITAFNATAALASGELGMLCRDVLVLSGHHFFPGLEEPWPHRDECLRINCSQAPDSVHAGIRLMADEVRRACAP